MERREGGEKTDNNIPEEKLDKIVLQSFQLVKLLLFPFI